MIVEKIFCRACHQELLPNENVFFQHHQSCAIELLNSYYELNKSNRTSEEEYVVMRSLLAVCLTYLSQIKSILNKVSSDTMKELLSIPERNFLDRNLIVDIQTLMTEIKKYYPNLANALDNISDVVEKV